MNGHFNWSISTSSCLCLPSKKKKAASLISFHPVTSRSYTSTEASWHTKGPNCCLSMPQHWSYFVCIVAFLTTDASVPLIRLPILVRCPGIACRAQHLVAATSNLMHPHNVHDVQADTGADPGYTPTPGHQIEGLSAIDCIHTTVVDWHDSDADHEKDYCHGNTICYVGPGGLWIT